MASKKRTQREEPCVICGHYHDYEAGEQCSICGHVLAAHEVVSLGAVIPTAIIPGFLYLGSYDSASRSELLKTMGITHILNTVPACQALFKNTFTYHTVTESPPPFQECVDFIDQSSQQPNSKVLVYCMTGVSRSPSIVIAYLMKIRGWRLAESYKWVKDKRDKVDIKPDEAKRLVDLEVQLHGSCSVPLGFGALNDSSGAFPSSLNYNTQQPASGDQGFSVTPSHTDHASSGPRFGAMLGQPQWAMSSRGAQPVVFGSGSQPAANFPGQQQQQQQQHPPGGGHTQMEM